MKNVFFSVMLALVATIACAQESQTGYNFLRLPVSAHAGALGGDNITIIEDDPSLMFANPALLGSVEGKAVNLNYMNYMEGANLASASFATLFGEKGTIGVMVQYINYGTMKQMDENHVQTGEFSAKDISVAGALSYQLGTNFVGGITARIVNSYIGDYNAMAVGVDLGLNYYLPESEWSLSAVVKNLGGEVNAYNDDYTRLPIDLQAGVSKRLVGSPLRLSATLVDLNHLDYKFIDHLVAGVDLILSDQIYVAAGYNFRRAHEMEITAVGEENGSSHGAGLSFGAGLQLERFKLNLAYAKYHISSHSLMVNVTINL